MDFIDYYAVLNLPKNARTRDVQKTFEEKMKEPTKIQNFELVSKAYATLSNRYKRARYDRTIGHLMVIQITPQDYLTAITYQLNSIQPYPSLLGLIEKFKAWIERRYDLDWQEAQLGNFSYHLENNHEKSYLLLRFPTENSLESFGKYLRTHKLVKSG